MRDHVYPQPVRRLGVEVDIARLALAATLGKNRAGYKSAEEGVGLDAYLAALAALAHPLTHLQTSPHTSPHTFFQHLAATTVS